MKLSDFQDEKAVQVIAKLLVPINNIAQNKDNADARGKSTIEFASSVLSHNAKDVLAIFAILNDEDPATYHCNAATVMTDLIDMLSDPALIQLFGLQRQTSTSSPSASMSGEVEEA